jgi:hypothetical protein
MSYQPHSATILLTTGQFPNTSKKAKKAPILLFVMPPFFYNAKIGQLLESLTVVSVHLQVRLEEAAETCYARRRSSL